MRNLRLWFSKTGRIKYVSHLDLNRCLLRAIRRSGIPIWYTEGFNPHPYISFALPLPLGVESVMDIMDLKIEGEIENDLIIEKINACLPEGLEFTRAKEPVSKTGEIYYAAYEIFVNSENPDLEEIEALLKRDEIIIEKTGKVGGKKVLKQVNIALNIKSFSFNQKSGQTILKTMLGAGSENTVNPLALIEYLNVNSNNGFNFSNARRTLLLKEDMTEFS